MTYSFPVEILTAVALFAVRVRAAPWPTPATLSTGPALGARSDDAPKPRNNTGAIVRGAITGVVCLIMITWIAIVLVRKKMQSKTEEPTPQHTQDDCNPPEDSRSNSTTPCNGSTSTLRAPPTYEEALKI